LSEERWNRVYVPSKHEVLTLAINTSDMCTEPARLSCVCIKHKLSAEKNTPTTPPAGLPLAPIVPQTVEDVDCHGLVLWIAKEDESGVVVGDNAAEDQESAMAQAKKIEGEEFADAQETKISLSVHHPNKHFKFSNNALLVKLELGF
jgi:hypothetical protein